MTRPLVKKFSKKRVQPTNADRYIGLEGIVEETVDNTEGTGIVKVEGSTWTARSSDGSRIEKVQISPLTESTALNLWFQNTKGDYLWDL